MKAQVFSMHAPMQVFFGFGGMNRIPEIILQERTMQGTVLVLTDKGVGASGIPQGIVEKIDGQSIPVMLVDTVPREPYAEDVDTLAKELRPKGIGFIVGVGGGSVLDTAKILSILLQDPTLSVQSLLDDGVPGKGLPTLLVPTTAGTGSEATPVAIVALRQKRLKVGLVSPFLVARYVVLDPQPTISLPPALTAATGLDAFCHLVECYTSKKANPYSDLLALEGMRLVFASLRTAYTDGNDRDSRSNMLLAAYYGGLCISSSSTTGIHALSYPLGGMYRIPHGVANAMLLAPVMEFNRDAVAEKFRIAAQRIGVQPAAGETDPSVSFVRALKELVEYVGIPSHLSDFGIQRKDIPDLTDRALQVTRLLSNNPKPMSRVDAASIYERIL